MSILSAAMGLLAASSTAPGTASTQVVEPATAAGALFVILFFSVLSVVLAVKFGVFRRNDIVGPLRVPRQGAGMLMLVFFVTICTWVCAQSAYIGHKQTEWKQAGMRNIPKDLEPLLNTQDWAILSTIPPTLGFLVMLAAGAFLNEGWLDRLGITLRRFKPGIVTGIIGFLIAGPPIFWTLIFLTKVYQYLEYEHPTEHVLLKSLGQAEHRWAGMLITVGATICAPLFEEFLFRGHLQTLFRQMLMRMYAKQTVAEPSMSSPSIPPPAAPAILVSELQAIPGIDPNIHPLEYQPAPSTQVDGIKMILQPAPWHGWGAILLTSLIFAGFHPLWMWPPIFVLSIGLGYVYERTGNLWATITIHFLFNSLETLQYLLLMRRH